MNGMPTYRIIFHIDMNAFFASCEMAVNKDLLNKPIVIAHHDPFYRSIILTASYEARKFGIYTTMLVKDALLRCPQLIVVEPHYHLYEEYSQKFFAYMKTVTTVTEQTSIDEGFFDLTAFCQNKDAFQVAKEIQLFLWENYQLPCSIGIAPNKFLAKMASDMKKPMGITILRKRDIATLLWPLPINAIIGVGKKTRPKLEAVGIKTIGQCAKKENRDLLQKTVGIAMAEYLFERANGNDTNVIESPTTDVSSISNAHTFSYRVTNPNEVKNTLKVLSNSVSNRLIESNRLAQTIGIQIKYANMQQINRSQSALYPIQEEVDLWAMVEELFDEYYEKENDIRLVGVFATRLKSTTSKSKQITIFEDWDQIEKENELQLVLRQIQNNLGANTIKVGYYSYEKEDKEK